MKPTNGIFLQPSARDRAVVRLNAVATLIIGSAKDAVDPEVRDII